MRTSLIRGVLAALALASASLSSSMAIAAAGPPGTAQAQVQASRDVADLLRAGIKVETVKNSTAVDRGTIVGFSGAQISTTSGSQMVTLTTAPMAGTVILGQQIAATGVPAGATINALASGVLGAVGSTYTLSANASATGTGVAATSGGPQQLMPANSVRRGFALQNQSGGACYLRGSGAATADWHSLKLGADAYYDTPDTHSGTGTLSVICANAASPLYSREW